MSDSTQPPNSSPKGFLHWLLIILDIALLILLLLIYYNLFTSDSRNLADILLASLSVLITIFSLTPAVNHWEAVKRTCAKFLFLGILLFIFCTNRCRPDVQLLHDLTTQSAMKDGTFIMESKDMLDNTDTTTAAGIIDHYHQQQADSLLKANQVPQSCTKEFLANFTAAEEKAKTQYLRDRQQRVRLCRDLNRIISSRNKSLIGPLFYDWRIAPEARIIQLHTDGSIRDLSSLKILLSGIVNDGFDQQIHPKKVTAIQLNEDTHEIDLIEFINE